MLQINQVVFDERPSPECPGYTEIRGALTLRTGVRVSQHELERVREDMQERIRRGIWHAVYGDILKPLNELGDLVIRTSRAPGVYLRAEELLREIRALLTPK